VKLKIIGSGVGAVTENDVLLASASGAIVIAFGIRPDRKAMELALQEHVDIRLHTIIYEVSDEIKKAMEGLLEPVIQETYLGRAEVRNTFRVKGSGTVAGCYVVDGVLKRDAQIRVMRDGAVIYTSKLSSLKRFKDDASEVRTGFECGAGIANFNDVKVGDVLECFSVQKLSAVEAAGQTVGTVGRRYETIPGALMPVGLLTLELHIPDAQSLKDKRQVLRSLKDRLRRQFNVAVAELDHHDCGSVRWSA